MITTTKKVYAVERVINDETYTFTLPSDEEKREKDYMFVTVQGNPLNAWMVKVEKAIENGWVVDRLDWAEIRDMLQAEIIPIGEELHPNFREVVNMMNELVKSKEFLQVQLTRALEATNEHSAGISRFYDQILYIAK